MPTLENEELYERHERMRELKGTPDYIAWIQQHNLKGLLVFSIEPVDETKWEQADVRFADDLTAFRIKMYFGDFLPLTKAAIETWPLYMELFQAITGLDKVFETCDEAVAFALGDYYAFKQLYEWLIYTIYKSFYGSGAEKLVHPEGEEPVVPTQEHLQWAKGDAAADSPTRCEGAWFTYKELMTSLAGIGGADQQRAEHAEKKEKERKQAEQLAKIRAEHAAKQQARAAAQENAPASEDQQPGEPQPLLNQFWTRLLQQFMNCIIKK